MTAFNLPPGVSLNDVDPFDPWEKVLEAIQSDCDKAKWTDCDCFVAWRLGCVALQKAKDLGAKFPHD